MCSVVRYSESEVVLKYAEWALERDEEMAAHIFTKRDNPLSLSSNRVLEFLSPFNLATVLYLEYVIQDQGSKVRLFIKNVIL